MTDKKQIEEMAKALGDAWICDLEGNPHDLCEVLMKCDIEIIAEQLYKAGYRKQSEGEWITDDLGNVCTKCGRTYDPDFDIKPRMIKQFKYCPNCGAKMKGAER